VKKVGLGLGLGLGLGFGYWTRLRQAVVLGLEKRCASIYMGVGKCEGGCLTRTGVRDWRRAARRTSPAPPHLPHLATAGLRHGGSAIRHGE